MVSVWAHLCMKYLGCFNETDAVRLYTRCMCFLSTHEPLESLAWMIQKGTCLTSVCAWQGLCGSASFCNIHLGHESCFTNQNVWQNLFFICYLHLKHKGHFKCAQGDLSPEEPNLPNNLGFKLCNVNYFTVDFLFQRIFIEKHENRLNSVTSISHKMFSFLHETSVLDNCNHQRKTK